MLIGVSAAQGQGKTTILNDLTLKGYEVIKNKTSRSILKRWGYNLAEINAYAPLAVKFQDEILKVHEENNNYAINSSEIVLQERTYADVMSYAIFTDIGGNNYYSKWIDDYYNKCKELQNDYACVIFLSGRKNFEVQDDGVRATNKHYQKAIDMLIKLYVEEFNSKGNVLYVDTSDHNERVEMITKHIKRFT